VTARQLGVVLAALTASWPGTPASAAGLEVFSRGARAMGRGGAFVAGADDPSGLLYNPATIGGLLGVQVSADFALAFYQASYTGVDAGGNLMPGVSNAGSLLPLPAAAISLPVYRDRLFMGLTINVPYAPYVNFPRPGYGPCSSGQLSGCLDTAHADAPQRYSAISNEGTKLVELGISLTGKLAENLYAGVLLQNLFVTYDTLSSITTYNGALSSGPEDPDYDVLTQMKLNAFFNPSAKLGLLWAPHPQWRLGLAYQLPFWIKGGAAINTQLPVSALYQKASVVGDQATVSFTLPMHVRFGVEWAPLPGLRVETDFEWTNWSFTKAITVQPENIYILNLPSIDRFKVPTMEVKLNFQDSYAFRLGGEYRFKFPLVLRLGYVYERGAVEPKYASVLSLDNDKHVITCGLSYTLWTVRLDVGLARSFSATRVVPLAETQVYQINPINQGGAAKVGAGSYHSDFTLLGMGLAKTF
jgi:long-chain fatty acid transport protein